MKIFDSSFDGKVISLNKKFAWAIMLLSGLLMLAGWQWDRITSTLDGMWTGSRSTSVVGGPPVAHTSVKVKLDQEKWSDWVKLPPNSTFQIEPSGKWVAIKYWDGREWDSRKSQDSTTWRSNIPNGTFRLRGEGEATILVDSP